MSRRTLLAHALLGACLAAAPAGAATYTVNIPGDPGAAPPPGFYTLRTAVSPSTDAPNAFASCRTRSRSVASVEWATNSAARARAPHSSSSPTLVPGSPLPASVTRGADCSRADRR